MARDDLNDPLGQERAEALGPQQSVPWGYLALGGCGVLALSLLAFTQLVPEMAGGEPIAVASIIPFKKPDLPLPTLPTQSVNVQESTGSSNITKQVSSADEVEMQSGVKVIRRGNAPTSGALIIQVPQTFGGALTPSPDKRLAEKSRFGVLPRIAADGSRAADIYARPVNGIGVKAGAPRIAIMVGGMGLSSGTTQEAVDKLPGAVTLAFAPYGGELEKQVAQARAQGHEVILQTPMEPFDYPQNDPGPHTLREASTTSDTIDDLHWLMGRFTGYAGVGNFLGARFTANKAAVAPVLQDIAARGLFYVEDGASPQSLVPDLAGSLGLDALRADVIIDSNSKPEAIAASLLALEALARKKGSALGLASGLPASVDQVARFAKALEAKGIMLVPVSALVNRAPKPAAQRQ